MLLLLRKLGSQGGRKEQKTKKKRCDALSEISPEKYRRRRHSLDQCGVTLPTDRTSAVTGRHFTTTYTGTSSQGKRAHYSRLGAVSHEIHDTGSHFLSQGREIRYRGVSGPLHCSKSGSQTISIYLAKADGFQKTGISLSETFQNRSLVFKKSQHIFLVFKNHYNTKKDTCASSISHDI